MHLAAQEGNTDVAELLLQRGANVNCRSKNFLTPMHLAAQEDQVPVAEILVRYNSEIDPQTKVNGGFYYNLNVSKNDLCIYRLQ